MNPYYKKYCEWLENNDEHEDVNFTDIHKMTNFQYEVYYMEEMRKKNIFKKIKIKLEQNEYLNTKWNEDQILHNEVKKMDKIYKENKKPFWFITICPKPGADFNEFKSSIEDISTFIWVDKCYWCFEQRGETLENAGEGFHAHVILEKYNIAPSKLKTIMKNKFSKFITVDKYIDNKINLLQKQKEFLQDKLDYIMGLKQDETKPLKCEIDKKWREQLNLKLFYQFDILTDERRISNSLGGRREGSGVKKGTKRGKYKCKKNNKHIVENEINEIKFIKKKNVLEF